MADSEAGIAGTDNSSAQDRGTSRRTTKRRLPDKEPLLIAIGARIRSLRETKGYSQEPFALMAEIDRSYYGAVERGRYSVTATNLARIAVALDVEVGELFPSREELKALLREK